MTTLDGSNAARYTLIYSGHNALSQHVISLGRRQVSRCAARARRAVCTRGNARFSARNALAARGRARWGKEKFSHRKRQRDRARHIASPWGTARSLPCARVRLSRRCSPGGLRTLQYSNMNRSRGQSTSTRTHTDAGRMMCSQVEARKPSRNGPTQGSCPWAQDSDADQFARGPPTSRGKRGGATSGPSVVIQAPRSGYKPQASGGTPWASDAPTEWAKPANGYGAGLNIGLQVLKSALYSDFIS